MWSFNLGNIPLGPSNVTGGNDRAQKERFKNGSGFLLVMAA